ncbi:MAG TPA: DUF456 domain-containing protein [Levilinea sp.]|nr:DUF456 domain-containing protein [Levilinea sp.]
MENELVLRLIVLGVMLFGLLALVIPVIPGIVIIWLAALVYGIIAGFEMVGFIIFVLLTLIMLGSTFLDEVIIGASSRAHGASWRAVAVAAVAGVIGTILLPPFGGLLGAIIGIFVVELMRVKDLRTALHSTRGVVVGCGGAVLAKLVLGVIMISLWLAWAFLS